MTRIFLSRHILMGACKETSRSSRAWNRRAFGTSFALTHPIQSGRTATSLMDDVVKLGPFPLFGEADPVPQSLFHAYPEQAKTLMLLHEVSREFTAILDRVELLRRVAQRVKKLVNYHVFSVMLWNEQSQRLESVFTLRYEDPHPVRLSMALNEGITGTAAAERRTVRVNDVVNDPRHVTC